MVDLPARDMFKIARSVFFLCFFYVFANPSLLGKVFLDVLDGKAMDSDSSLLEECRFCKRKFRFDRIAKHETRCPESKAGLETTGSSSQKWCRYVSVVSFSYSQSSKSENR